MSSLAWTGHLVLFTISGSMGQYITWNDFIDVLAYREGLGHGSMESLCPKPDSSSHFFGQISSEAFGFLDVYDI